jgi:DNA-binding transcriptional ArsR family regulator
MRARTQFAGATHSHQDPGDAEVDAAAAAFRLLGDPTRLRLMWVLGDTERDVTSLTEAVGAARPAVSQHLAKLRLAGLVDTRKVGQRVLYRARDSHVRNLIAEALSHAEHETTGIPRHD